MIKRIYLFLALSLFYSSAMIVVGGYNVASDAAQLWNSQRGSNDSSSGSGYYNSQRSGKGGKTHLFNGEGNNGIQREGLRDGMAYTYLQYENRQRSRNRAPAVFQYMSPYAVANRLDDIDNSLRFQSERMKASRAMLKKANKDYDPQKSADSRRDAYQKVASRASRSLGLGNKNKDYKSAKAKNRNSGNRSGGVSSQETSSSGASSSVGGSSSTLYNSSSSSNSGSGNKKSTLFNSSN